MKPTCKFTQAAIKKYRELAQIPTPLSVEISFHRGHEEFHKEPKASSSSPTTTTTAPPPTSTTHSHISLETKFKQVNVNRSKSIQLHKNIVLPTNNFSQSQSSKFQPIVDNILWDVSSPSGKLRAICLFEKKNEEKKFFIEIWRSQGLINCIDATAQKIHGDIYGPSADGTIGTFHWSNSETHLLYVAEKYKVKSKSFFESTIESTSSASTSTDNNVDAKTKIDENKYGENNLYEENFGEQLNEIKNPILCLLHVEEGKISTLMSTNEDEQQNPLSGWLPTSAIWCPDDNGLLIVAMRSTPYRLGVIYCTQRPSALFHFVFETNECTIVGHDNRAVSFPRFSPNGERAIWLEQEAGGPHGQCQRLISCDWPSKEIHTVIDIVEHAGSSAFPGLFVESLPKRVWCKDNQRIVLTSQWNSRNELLLVDIDLKLGKRLPLPSEGLAVGSAILLDISALPHGSNDVIVAAFSSPSRPPYLAIAYLPKQGLEDNVEWYTISLGCDFTLPTVDCLNWRIQRHTPNWPHPTYGAADFESILLTPTTSLEQTKDGEETKFPLILLPHGGPHGAFVASFLLYPAVFVACGFGVLLVNYRGSTGFGQDFIRTLLGYIGDIDVSDCMRALNDTLALEQFDKNRVAVFGGSHGGFLTSHLIGQHGNAFRVACARNPVINIASMFTSTDIPDWCLVEAGFPDGPLLNADADIISRMYNVSPIRWINQMKTPTLIMIGDMDLRVPPSQGKELYRALKARNIPVKLYAYPDDCHPLSSIATQSEACVLIVKWFADWMELNYTPPAPADNSDSFR